MNDHLIHHGVNANAGSFRPAAESNVFLDEVVAVSEGIEEAVKRAFEVGFGVVAPDTHARSYNRFKYLPRNERHGCSDRINLGNTVVDAELVAGQRRNIEA